MTRDEAEPPHLAAICVWEGWVDNYRDSNRHGGIICVFRKNWQDMQVKTVQHGFPSGKNDPNTGVPVCGSEIISDFDLAKNREDMWQAFLSRETWDDYYAERSPDLSQVTTPLMTAVMRYLTVRGYPAQISVTEPAFGGTPPRCAW